MKHKKDSAYWRKQWIYFVKATPLQIEVSSDMDFRQFVGKDGRFSFMKASEAVFKEVRARITKEEKVYAWHPKSAYRGIHSQRTSKEWGSLYRPARSKR